MAANHGDSPNPAGSAGSDERPRWDGRTGLLTFGGKKLLVLPHPVSNQICLLDAFEAMNWAADPLLNPLAQLPHETAEEHRQRLYVTAKNLNSHLSERLIRFRVRGDYVHWERDAGRE